ncbi:hypothetical protein MRX96_043368 [Rhipicephalus microplus]
MRRCGVVRAPLGKRTPPLRAQEELLHHEKQSRMPGYDPPCGGHRRRAERTRRPMRGCLRFPRKTTNLGRRGSRCRDRQPATRHCGGRLSGTH